ncbi:hypothetical protein HU765_20260 [Pseudomonas sp. SWRI81]|uniref:hypothetical protein n=1 Tax=Pseudomonas sp. SWRI81 TaxID=2745505 RepID=UPI0016493341|nr:hypothetical protein [Pseudomonas sp. SWRI81]MBC3272275.1 hypothetical protein [Pseudomonas sp. SWRI81]
MMGGKSNSKFGVLVNVGLAVIFLLLFSLLYFYSTIFDGDVSRKAESWSAFGSFFGGVFGPVISLVTLFALLRTIQLQKELLVTQSTEFDALSSLQSEQLIETKLSDYKTHQLQLLHQQVSMFEQMQDRYNKEGERIVATTKDFYGTKSAAIIKLDEAIVEMEDAIGKLIKLSIKVSLTTYTSIEQIRSDVSEGLESIHPFFAEINIPIVGS